MVARTTAMQRPKKIRWTSLLTLDQTRTCLVAEALKVRNGFIFHTLFSSLFFDHRCVLNRVLVFIIVGISVPFCIHRRRFERRGACPRANPRRG